MSFKFTYRRIALIGLASAVASLPYSFNVKDGVSVSSNAAHAKDAGGKDNGNSGGNGGNSGNGNSGSGNNGNGNNGQGQSAGRGSQKSEAGKSVNAKTGDLIDRKGRDISVRHRNGIQESIVGSIYEMTDSKGRLVIRRTATSRDRARLAAMAG